MPNWCEALVTIRGKPENIKEFCKLFIYDEEHGSKQNPFFARSFIEDSWKNVQKAIMNKSAVSLNVNFAWSATSCLINGYPQDYPETITLQDACKKHKVGVVIDTEEPGIGFEEHIKCSPKGELVEECNEMPVWTCKCGSKQMIPTAIDPEYQVCWDCEKIGEWRREENDEKVQEVKKQ